jgi:hypothetical protein
MSQTYLSEINYNNVNFVLNTFYDQGQRNNNSCWFA